MYFNYLYLSFLETIKYRIPTSHTGVGILSFFFLVMIFLFAKVDIIIQSAKYLANFSFCRQV